MNARATQLTFRVLAALLLNPVHVIAGPLGDSREVTGGLLSASASGSLA